MFATDGWTCCVNAAITVELQVLAFTLDQQGPAVFVLVHFDVVMRDLPQQVLELRLGARGVNVVGDISAAYGTGAE